MTPGDRYDLMPPGANDAPLVQAVVERIDAGNGVLSLAHGVSAADLPPGTSARPAEVALTVRPVAVLPAGHPHREQVAARLDAEARVRSGAQPAGALATGLLGGDDIQMLDAGGQPLYPQPLPLPASLGAVVRDVRTLAIADDVRAPAGPAAATPNCSPTWPLPASGCSPTVTRRRWPRASRCSRATGSASAPPTPLQRTAT